MAGVGRTQIDVWHIDLIGKFRSPSLGGNVYTVSIIENHSRYCMAVPIKTKSSVEVLAALQKCMADFQTNQNGCIPTGAANSKVDLPKSALKMTYA